MHSNQRPAGMLHRHLNRMVDKYPCRECDVSFKTCDEFTSHLRRVHNDFRFVCHICAKMFKLKGSLLVHQRVVHQSPEGEGHHCSGNFVFQNYYYFNSSGSVNVNNCLFITQQKCKSLSNFLFEMGVDLKKYLRLLQF